MPEEIKENIQKQAEEQKQTEKDSEVSVLRKEMQELRRDLNNSAMGGSSTAGSPRIQKTPEQIRKEQLNSKLAPLGLKF